MADNSNIKEPSRNIAPGRLELLIAVVDNRKAALYRHLIQSCGVNVQIAVPAKGTTPVEILNYLGLADRPKTAIFGIVRSDRADELIGLIQEKFDTVKGGKGIAATVPLTSVIGKMIYGFLGNDKRTVNNIQKTTEYGR